jgi:chemotaxis signal transduction protein
VVLFRVGPEWLAMDVRHTVEVAPARPIRRVPHQAGGLLAGLVNVRGELQLAVSLRHLLGVDAMSEGSANPRHLVAEHDGARWVFPADEVFDIRHFRADELGAVPDTVSASAQSLTRLLSLAGESLVEARWLQPFARSLLKLKKHQDHLADVLDEVARSAGTDAAADTRRRLAECRQGLADRIAVFESHARQSDDLNSRLYREVIASRMRPFADGTRGLARMARDVARQLGKKVTVRLLGQDTEWPGRWPPWSTTAGCGTGGQKRPGGSGGSGYWWWTTRPSSARSSGSSWPAGGTKWILRWTGRTAGTRSGRHGMIWWSATSTCRG